jgi:hypothetical protein
MKRLFSDSQESGDDFENGNKLRFLEEKLVSKIVKISNEIVSQR